MPVKQLPDPMSKEALIAQTTERMKKNNPAMWRRISDTRLLDSREEKAVAVIEQYMRQKYGKGKDATIPDAPPSEKGPLYYGAKRGILYQFTEPVLMWGMPATWTQANIAFWGILYFVILLFVSSNPFIVFSFLVSGGVIQLIGIAYYYLRRESMRQGAIDRIVATGQRNRTQA
jgi:hypothetical protein